MSTLAKKVWRPFEEAREFARSLNLRGKEEWEEYSKSGERPDDIPSHPNDAYKNVGWKDWGDWLGTGSIANKNKEFLPFDEAREFARSLQLKTQDEWNQYLKSGKDGIPKPDDIPANPGIIYKNDGWKGMIDWLGNGIE